MANNAGNNTNLISVVDVSRPGREAIIEEIPTPVNPVDLAIARGRLYVIDQWRRRLFDRPLRGGDWSSIRLSRSRIAWWQYGDMSYAHGHRMFVIHPAENLVDVVDLERRKVERTVRDVDGYPEAIALAGNHLAVLSSCVISVFRLSDLRKVYRQQLDGCAWGVAQTRKRLYVQLYTDFRTELLQMYDVRDGKLLHGLAVPSDSRHITVSKKGVIAQDGRGGVFLVDFGLRGILGGPYDLLTRPQVWFPPIEEMVVMPDGRLFVTNRNDDSLSIVDMLPN